MKTELTPSLAPIPSSMALVPAMGEIDLIVVYNPFDAAERTVAKLDYIPCRSLAAYLDGLPTEVSWGVALNGRPIDREHWDCTFPRAGDFLVVMPIPHGDGGKQIFRLVAMIAVAVFAAWVAGPAVLGLTGLAAGAFTAAFSFAGSLLINAILPGPKPNGPEKRDFDNEEGPAYGLDGPKNTATEDVPVPVIYGQFRVGGNIIANYVDNAGDTQFLSTLFALSEGRVESITDVEINQQPAANYEAVEIDRRLGENEEAIIPWFADNIRPVNKGVKLSESFLTHTSTTEINRFRIDIVFPNGLVEISAEDGDKFERTVDLTMEYRVVGAGSWTPLANSDGPKTEWANFAGTTSPVTTNMRVEVSDTTTGTQEMENINIAVNFRKVGDTEWQPMGDAVSETIRNNGHWTSPAEESTWIIEATTVTKVYSKEGLPEAAYEFQVTAGDLVRAQTLVGSVTDTITARQRTAIRRSFLSPVLANGSYEIRVKRNSPESTDDLIIDQVYVSDINEIIVNDVKHVNTAMLALRMKLTNQLNSQPTVTSLVKGVMLNEYNGNGDVIFFRWSANPAWIALDIMTNARYGAGISVDRIDIPRFVEWARYCEEKGFEFNGVFDFRSNIWEGLKTVLRVGHAQLVPVGVRLSLALEKPSQPVMMFGAGNIVKDTFGIDWLPMEDRANEVEVTYYDETDGYKRNTVRLTDFDNLATGAVPKTSSFTLLGISKGQQALYEAHFQLALNKYIRQTVTFDAPIEAIACVPGDLIYVQHDMPQWGYAGRLDPASTTTVLTLDKVVPGTTTKVLVHHSAVNKGSAAISSSAGKIIHFETVDLPPQPWNRLVSGSADRRIAAVIDLGNGFTEIDVDDASGLSGSVEFWDTDSIEERDVSAIGATADGRSTLTLSSALSQAPAAYANWMAGTSVTIKKPFRVFSISGSQEYERTIRALEYNESVYTDPENAVPTPNQSDLDTIGQAIITGVVEDAFVTGNITRSKITVGWKKPTSGKYAGADVWAATNGEDFQMLGTVNGEPLAFAFEANVGDVLRIKVVAFSTKGNRASLVEAMIVDYTVVGKITPPGPPDLLLVLPIALGTTMAWFNPTDPDYDVTEIWESTTNDRDTAVKVGEVRGTTFTQWGPLTAGIPYYYWIRARDTSGNVSEWHPVDPLAGVSAIPLDGNGTDGIPPAVPTALVLATSTWTDPTGQTLSALGAAWNPNSEPDLDHYEIAYKIDTETEFVIIPVATSAHSWWVIGGQNYEVKVRAVDKSGNRSDFTEIETIVSASINDAPATPTGLILVTNTYIDSTGVELSAIGAAWNANPEGDILHYEIAFHSSADATEVVNVVAGTNYTWWAVAGATYFVKVRAVDRDGLKSAYSSEETIEAAAPDLPDVPTGLAITVETRKTGTTMTERRLVATWNANPETNLAHYILALREGSSGVWVERVVSATRYEQFTVGGASFSGFQGRIRAVNTRGQMSDWSSVVNETTIGDTTPPAQPTNITLIPGLRTITVQWSMPTDDDLAGIKVLFNTTGNPASKTLLTSTALTSFVHSNLTAGTTYYYWLVSYDYTGNESAVTTVVSATPGSIQEGDFDSGAPSTPAGLSLSQSTTVNPDGTVFSLLTATWTANSETDLSHYEWAIKEGSGGNYVYGAAGQPSVSWPVKQGVTYFVKVRAVDFVANASSYTSDASLAIAADSTIPSTPTGFIATGTFNSVWLIWNDHPAADFSHMEVYENTTNNSSTAGLIATAPGSQFVRSGLAGGVTRWYWLKAVDFSGNKSGFGIGIQATTKKIEEVDYADLSIGNAAIKNGVIDDAKIVNLSAAKLVAGTALAGSITVSSRTLSNISDWANDPAARINAGPATFIQPGKILISGGTTLDDWRNGADNTKIEGGSIATNTVSANKMEIGSRGLKISGLQFSFNKSTNQLSWTTGTIVYVADTGVITTVNTSSSLATWSSGTTMYAYWIKGETLIRTTTTPSTAIGADRVTLATYRGGSNLVANYGRTMIDGGQIHTNTLHANAIQAGTITGEKIAAGEITGDLLAAANIITNSAQIGNAMVQTLNLAGQAVTLPIGTTPNPRDTTYEVTLNAYQTFLSLNINVSGNNPVLVISSMRCEITNGSPISLNQSLGISINDGTNTLYFGGFTSIAGGSSEWYGYSQNFSNASIHFPGAGPRTYVLQCSKAVLGAGRPQCFVQYLTLTAIELKR